MTMDQAAAAHRERSEARSYSSEGPRWPMISAYTVGSAAREQAQLACASSGVRAVGRAELC